MKPRTILAWISWLWLISGLLGLLGAFLSSSYDEISPYPGLCLAALGTLGFAFLAYLDTRLPPAE